MNADPDVQSPGADTGAAARLRLLLDASVALSALDDTDERLRALAALVARELGDYVVTYTLEAGGAVRRVGTGHSAAVDGDVMQALLRLPAPRLGTPGAGHVMASGEPVFAPSVPPEFLEGGAQSPEHLALLRRLRPTSSIVVPLRGRESIFGAVALATVEGGRPPFDRADLEFAVELAARAGLIAENRRLYDDARAELERRRETQAMLRVQYEQLRVLYQMTEAVSRAGAAEEVFEEALDALRFTMEADRASILLYDDDGVLRFKAWRGLSASYRQAVEGHSPWTRASIDPDPIVVPDVRQAADLEPELRDTILAEGIRALVFIPLSFGPGLLGKFMVYFDRPWRADGRVMDLARAVARNVAFAIARVRADEELRAARDSAERANQVKSQFLAVMSHELRTPLNAVLGYADLLEVGVEGRLSPTQAGQVGRIRASARLLTELIDEILVYARLEAGREEVRVVEADLCALAHEAAAMVEPTCRAKGLAFRLRMPEAPVVVRTDPGKLRQILLNLLSNAAKFTDEGGVTLLLRRTAAHIELAVEDTGPGIPPTDRERIFEPFVQGDGSITREKSGTGLGLAVSRRLAELLGGRIDLVSRTGEGSRFVLHLPPTPAREA